MKPHTIIALSLLSQSCAGLFKDYKDHKVLRLNIDSTNKEAVTDLINNLGLETWLHPSTGQGYADVVVTPSTAARFKSGTTNMTSSVMHNDLAESILENMEFDAAAAGSANEAWFNSYHSYAQHLQFINDLIVKFPQKTTKVYSGMSFEGRNITGIRVSAPGSKPNTKPAIVWHGTVHAREWITTMVVEYLTYRLLQDSATDSTIAGVLNRYDVYIFPVVNPDGFVFTQTNDRLARKNRRPAPFPGICAIGSPGVDINRNWPFQWDAPGGSSQNPCAQDYRGASAGSEPETKGLARFLNARRNAPGGLKQYIDFHSYSQLFMWPYGYSCNQMIANNAKHAMLGTEFTRALREVHGVKYGSGPICPTLYAVSGGSVDYAYAVSKSEYVFTAELRDTGEYGFLLPKSQIRPSGQETWAGIRAVLAQMG